MRIMITGGAGFVGSTLVRQAVDAGHEVLNFDALTASASLAEVWDLEEAGNYTLVPGDVTDASAVEQAIAWFQPDKIIHLAHEGPNALTDDPEASYLQTNVVGMETVLRVARQMNGVPVILALSLPRHGMTPSFYSASQDAARAVARAFAQTRSAPVIETFAPAVFGPRQNALDPIPMTINRLLDQSMVAVADGPRTAMELVFVEDYAAALLTVAQRNVEVTLYRITGPRKIRPLGVTRQICRALNHWCPNPAMNYADLLEVKPLATTPQPPDPFYTNMPQLCGTTPFAKAFAASIQWMLEDRSRRLNLRPVIAAPQSADQAEDAA